MTTPHIDQVRQALMQTLQGLQNKEEPLDIERAKTIAQVATVLVDTAKVENEYLKITHQERSNFLEIPTTYERSSMPVAHNPFPTSVHHRLEG